ncbi:hypothetical protein NPIL_250211 [Nephila pilipes]|uniref:Uncharacterized protein n=1 Tax=Nephila pilipes TaxID=299642 RepID=A0A8X6NJ57_NEPPI|nr:hypothetical protein NPIL_250211 [Nephila pilipes]
MLPQTSGSSVYEVPEQDCDMDAEKIIEESQENAETEQSDMDLSSEREEDEEFYVCRSKKWEYNWKECGQYLCLHHLRFACPDDSDVE